MRYKVLDYLYQQGGLTLLATNGGWELPLEALQDTASALNAGAGFVILDFSGKFKFRENAPVPIQGFLHEPLEKSLVDRLSSESWLVSGTKAFPKNDEEFRHLYHNLHLLYERIRHVVGILPEDISREEAKYIPLISRLLILSGNSREEAAALI